MVSLYYFFFNEAPVQLKQREKTLHLGYRLLSNLFQQKDKSPMVSNNRLTHLAICSLFLASKLDEIDDSIPFFSDLRQKVRGSSALRQLERSPDISKDKLVKLEG